MNEIEEVDWDAFYQELEGGLIEHELLNISEYQDVEGDLTDLFGEFDFLHTPIEYSSRANSLNGDDLVHESFIDQDMDQETLNFSIDCCVEAPENWMDDSQEIADFWEPMDSQGCEEESGKSNTISVEPYDIKKSMKFQNSLLITPRNILWITPTIDLQNAYKR